MGGAHKGRSYIGGVTNYGQRRQQNNLKNMYSAYFKLTEKWAKQEKEGGATKIGGTNKGGATKLRAEPQNYGRRHQKKQQKPPPTSPQRTTPSPGPSKTASDGVAPARSPASNYPRRRRRRPVWRQRPPVEGVVVGGVGDTRTE